MDVSAERGQSQASFAGGVGGGSRVVGDSCPCRACSASGKERGVGDEVPSLYGVGAAPRVTGRARVGERSRSTVAVNEGPLPTRSSFGGFGQAVDLSFSRSLLRQRLQV